MQTNSAVAILLACMMLPLMAANTDTCSLKNTSYKPTESITYKVYYHAGPMNVPAGEVTFSTALQMYNKRACYHITGNGRTYSSYDWFFKVRDVFQTYIDTATLLPLRFARDVQEGGTKFKQDVSFDRQARTATSAKKKIDISACCQDVLSMIYYTRNFDFNKLQAGDKIFFDMYIDDEVFNLYIRYLGKEKCTTDLGTFNCVKFRPLLVKGTMFNGGEQMIVWATDDANHVPVRIEASIAVGEIRADLKHAKNLRHGLTSWVKKYYDK